MNNQYKIRKFKCIGCNRIVKKRRAINKLHYCSLICYRKSDRPQRKTGKIFKCEWCDKDTYKSKGLQRQHKFCSRECANKWQGKNKIEFICKICGKKFKWSKSRGKAIYCSIKCRNQDKEWIKNVCIKGNLIQQKKRGLNKLELTGKEILRNLKLEFNEQVLMFDKFLVDVLLKNKKIIIQWDGEYWHNKPKRKILDISQDAYMKKCGYKVLRFTDKEVYKQKEYVIANIKKAIQ
jgi:very-short-patch-repair endonuclease